MIEEALEQYCFKHPEAQQIRHNENRTYRVKDGPKEYLLRIHMAADGLDLSHGSGGLSRENLVESEIELLRQLSASPEIKTQRPVANKSGDFVTRLKNGDPATVLSWLNGGDLTNADITAALAYQIGETIGKTHSALSKVRRPKRFCYDKAFADELMAGLFDAAAMGDLTEEFFTPMQNALRVIREILKRERPRFIPVHADMSKSNLILSDGEICPIDFSLSGLGLAEMDLSDMNWTLHDNKLTPPLFAGYEAVSGRAVNRRLFRTCTALYPIAYTSSHHRQMRGDEKFLRALNRWRDDILNPFIMSET